MEKVFLFGCKSFHEEEKETVDRNPIRSCGSKERKKTGGGGGGEKRITVKKPISRVANKLSMRLSPSTPIKTF